MLIRRSSIETELPIFCRFNFFCCEKWDISGRILAVKVKGTEQMIVLMSLPKFTGEIILMLIVVVMFFFLDKLYIYLCSFTLNWFWSNLQLDQTGVTILGIKWFYCSIFHSIFLLGVESADFNLAVWGLSWFYWFNMLHFCCCCDF